MSLRPAFASDAVCRIAAAILLTAARPADGVAQTLDHVPAALAHAKVKPATLQQAPVIKPLVPPTAALGQVSPAADAAENAPDDTVLPIPPVPPRIAEGAAYDRCLDMLETDPSGADSLAASMAQSGDGDAAEHCHALAQVALGNTEDGATLLDKLAASSKSPPSARAEVFGQADQAWTMAGKPAQAYASAGFALRLSPDDPDLLIGHAIAALALDHPAEAAADLGHALDLDPKRADGFVLRATAERDLGKLDDARADIGKAFMLDAEDPDAFLERGIIRQRSGDSPGARADWQHVLDTAPDTPTGDLAQQNLALLEAGPRQ